jgi:hypothetical protein
MAGEEINVSKIEGNNKQKIFLKDLFGFQN